MNPQSVFEQLTLEEKAQLLTGKNNWWFEGIPRLGIRDFMVADGPHGIRAYKDPSEHNGHPKTRMPATSFTCASGMASTWNPQLIEEAGRVIGNECNHYSVDVILAPGVDGKRSPLGGRNFEYYSEDPFLTAQMGIAFVKGAQSTGIGTSLKHFALNEQETSRRFNSSTIDERTFRELYAFPFEQIVKQANPLTIMGAYNKVNGVYACENPYLIQELLRKEWGYQGIVISDWGGVQNKKASILAGLDIEMPASEWKKTFVEDVLNGIYPTEVIDETVKRILNVYATLLDNPNHGVPTNFEKNLQVAKKVASESIVLLKNEDYVLPLQVPQQIVVIGLPAKTPRTNGGGSSEMMAYKVEAPLEFMKAFQEVHYIPEYVILPEQKDIIKNADRVVIFTGTTPEIESEGFDRSSLFLPLDQINCIKEVAGINSNIIVVNSSGSSIDTRSFDSLIKGFVQTWLQGSGAGEEIAQVLYGVINPSGRLAETFPLRIEHTPTYPLFPEHGEETKYVEGLFSGYRFFDTHELPVRYPFGYGLSYTTFEYSNLQLSKQTYEKGDVILVSVEVKNTGLVSGHEVVQLYVSNNDSSYPQPKKILRAFNKVFLKPNESKIVSLEVPTSLLETFIPSKRMFLLEKGRYGIYVGHDSQDIRLQASILIESIDSTHPPKSLEHPTKLWMMPSNHSSLIHEFFDKTRKPGWWETEEPLKRVIKRIAKEYKWQEVDIIQLLKQLNESN